MIVIPLLLLFSLIFVANIVQARQNERLRRAFNWLLLLLNLPVFFAGLMLLLVSPDELAQMSLGEGFSAPRPAGVVLLAAAVWGLLVALPEVRRLLARWIPIEPGAPVHTLALMFSGYLAANGLLPLSQGGLEGLLETMEATSALAVAAGELLLLALAFAGVGLFTRRNLWKALDRLGLERPTARQVGRSLRWLPVLLVLMIVANYLLAQANPVQAEVMDELSQLLLGNMDTVWDWLLLAVAAGIGEEVLFRGALQPVLGIWLTSLLFAVIHTQYGLSIATLLIFVVGFILGVMRQRYNTTVAILLHAAYNFVLGLAALAAPALEEMALWFPW
ncbi:MAG: CPBP family intramembrane glutamic endopeptidase [Anaerolineae bacterium]|nr:CPBP family intramembrane glutamic endopeptidase [Anaerolineae bacterium]